MTILLAGDIGGTKTILRLVQTEPPSANQEYSPQTTLYEHTYASQEFSNLVPMVRQFMEAATAKSPTAPRPEKACFGIAGPVVKNHSNLPNLGWSLDAADLERELELDRVSLINDFAAVGYGVLGLAAEDIYTLQPGEPQPDAPIAVIGAGTGLGEGFLIRQATGYCTYASEGGHTDFAPRSELEFGLMRYVRERYNLERVSVERIVSGTGIVAIYQYLRDREVSQESPEMTEIYRTWQREIGHTHKTVDLAAAISQAAINQTDYLCQETMNVFMEAYGAEAGNFALKLLPYGGLYVAGGVAAKNLPLIKEGRFLQAFLHKGRISRLVEQVPIYIVLNPKVGLIGAALYAAKMA